MRLGKNWKRNRGGVWTWKNFRMCSDLDTWKKLKNTRRVKKKREEALEKILGKLFGIRPQRGKSWERACMRLCVSVCVCWEREWMWERKRERRRKEGLTKILKSTQTLTLGEIRKRGRKVEREIEERDRERTSWDAKFLMHVEWLKEKRDREKNYW